MKEIIESSKDYQLQSLIQQFTRFQQESVVNISTLILKEAIYLAKKECDKRGILYE